ncbi:unnamed protein product [Polarella glacialis]|uniref:Uncharacterized protein n=1 Tax=Polarella glacialis TaxID=89957 RepID=A0A813EF40_POLGL|nr:unnamed protein product [Polarella glacialis]
MAPRLGDRRWWLQALLAIVPGLAGATNIASCDIGDLYSVAIGDAVKFCVFLSTTPPRKMVFEVKVEEYAELLLQGSEQFINATTTQPMYTWVAITQKKDALPLNCASGGDMANRSSLVSCPQIYATPDRVAPLVNLVVNLREGQISSFAWDNGCVGCGPSSCMKGSNSFDMQSGVAGNSQFEQGTCGQKIGSCAGKDKVCSLKIFVTWAGTDRNGRNLVSAGLRLSKLSGATLGSLYDSMQTDYNQVVSR